jgi:predicted transcriptional regulator
VEKDWEDLSKIQRIAEDLSAKLWSVINSVAKSSGGPHLKAKREQLKVISESIDQLSQRNVPVPDDLPRLKKTLSEEIEKADKDQVILFFLKEQLAQMLATLEGNVDVKNSRAQK